MNQRAWLAGALAVALAGAIAATLVVRHPGGDPGIVRQNALRTISVALPSDAKVLIHSEGGPVQDSCFDRPGTHGWSDVVNGYQFTSNRAAEAVVANAQANLKSAGWTQVSTSSSITDPVVRWTKAVSGGVVAQAQLSIGRDGYVASFWDLSASAPPAGTRVSGC